MQKEVRVMDGDWICLKCSEHNFARRWTCFRCGVARENDPHSSATTDSTATSGTDGSASSTGTSSASSGSSQSQRGIGFSEAKYSRRGSSSSSYPSELSGRRDGDWNCTRCNALNFARRALCFGCNAPKETSASSSTAADNSLMLKGDWLCMNCRSHNFARRKICFSCSSPRYSLAYGSQPGEIYGDWLCLRCNELNFARRVNCFGCNAEKPTDLGSVSASSYSASSSSNGSSSSTATAGSSSSADSKHGSYSYNGQPMLEGDWICPKCNEHNFARRYACFGCNAPKHHHSSVAHPAEDGSWVCVHCSERNSVWYYLCLKCASPRFPHELLYAQSNRHEARPRPKTSGVMSGDWLCSKCSSHNFARRLSCFSCGTGKESAVMMY